MSYSAMMIDEVALENNHLIFCLTILDGFFQINCGLINNWQIGISTILANTHSLDIKVSNVCW